MSELDNPLSTSHIYKNARPNKYAIIYIITSALIGFHLGSEFDSQSNLKFDIMDSVPNNIALNPVTSKPNAEIKKLAAGANSNIDLSDKDNKLPIEEIVHKLNSLRDVTSMISYAESYLLVKDLSEGDLLQALTLSIDNVNDSNVSSSLFLLIELYAKVNPHGAMLFIDENIESPDAKAMSLNSIYSIWSINDPHAAFDWHQSNHVYDKLEGYTNLAYLELSGIFQQLAKLDLDDALSKYSSYPEGDIRAKKALEGISRSLTSKDEYLRLLEETSILTNQDLKDSVIRQWAYKSPEEVAQWLLSADDIQDKAQYERVVLFSWFGKNPVEAASWYMEGAEEDKKYAVAEKVIHHWVGANPDAALNWVKNQHSMDVERLTKALLISATMSDRIDFSVDNLNLLSDDKDKIDVSVNIYRSLKRRSELYAVDFIESSPFRKQVELQMQRLKEARQSKKVK